MRHYWCRQRRPARAAICMAAVRSCVVGPRVSGKIGVKGEHKRDRVWVAEALVGALSQGRLLRS